MPAPVAAIISGVSALTVAAVPTGMNAGGRHRPVRHLEHARARRAVRCDDPKHRLPRFGPFQKARVAIGVEAIAASQACA